MAELNPDRPTDPEDGAELDDDQVREDERLEQGLENTFPASDPPAVKHIT